MERPGQEGSFEYRPSEEEWTGFIAAVESLFVSKLVAQGSGEIIWRSDELGKRFMLNRSVLTGESGRRIALFNLYIEDIDTKEHAMISFGDIPRGVAAITGSADEDSRRGLSEDANESAEILLRIYLSTVPGLPGFSA